MLVAKWLLLRLYIHLVTWTVQLIWVSNLEAWMSAGFTLCEDIMKRSCFVYPWTEIFFWCAQPWRMWALCGHSYLSDAYVLSGGCKHGKVDNSWSLPSVQWKWFNFMYRLWVSWRKKIHRHFKFVDIAKQFMMRKKNSEKIRHVFKDGASGVQVGDID